jgi:hypothetical protein
MSATSPSLFVRLFNKLNPRLSFGVIACSIFLFLVAITNLFSVYFAVVDSDMQSVPLRLFAVLLYITPSIGLLMLKRWARIFGIILCCVGTLLGILTFLAISNADGAFIIATHGAVLWCLFSKKTRIAFATAVP